MSVMLLGFLATLGRSPVVTIAMGEDITVSDVQFGASSESRFRLQNDDMKSYIEILGNYITLGQWVTPSSAVPGDYQARAVIVSGSVSSGPIGAWGALSSTLEWTCIQASSGIKVVVIDVSIRKGTGPTLDTKRVTLEAEWSELA